MDEFQLIVPHARRLAVVAKKMFPLVLAFAGVIGVLTTSVSAQNATTLALTANPNPVYGGSQVTLMATAMRNNGSGTPTGNVTFFYGSYVLGTSNLDGAGIATLAEFSSIVPFGSYRVHAVYGGDASDSASTSNTLTVATAAGTTTTVVSASSNALISGQGDLLSATVTSNGGAVTGTATFYYGSFALGTGTLNAGVARLSASSGGIAPGSYGITAKYSGSTLQAGSVSVPETVTIQAAGDATQPLPNVTMELPLTEGSGTTAHDVSGNNNDATFCKSGSAPVWASSGLMFSEAPGAADACLDTPLNAWGSIFVYACPYPGAFPNNFLNPTANVLTLSGLWGPTTTTDGIGFLANLGGSYYGIAPTLFKYASDTYTTRSSQVNGGCHVYAVTLGTAADHIYVDGVEQSYGAQAADAGVAATVGHYQLGCDAGCAGGHDFQGAVNYVVVGSPQYTADQVTAESNYILQKVSPRGVGNFPLGTFTGDYIVAVGDSLSANRHGSSPPWFELLSTADAYTTTSLAIDRMLAKDMVAMWPNRENSYFSTRAAKQYCHIWAGTNDISDAFTAAAVWPDLMTLGKECIASGGTPIIATMISRTGLDTEKNELNALIRAGWQQAGFAALNDLAEYPALGADGAYANGTYFYTDGIHLTGPNGECDLSSGYSIVCHAVSNIVNLLDGSTARSPVTLMATGSIGYNRFVSAAPRANITLTLPDCSGLTGQVFQVRNTQAAYAVTIAASSGQTINGDGSVVLGGYATASFVDQLTAPSTGGCSWSSN